MNILKQSISGHHSLRLRPFERKQKRQILVVTGLSGSGKSSVMRSLEDLGFYCVDNFPVPLLSMFLDFVFHAHTNLLKVALGIDVRGGAFLNDFMGDVNQLQQESGESVKNLVSGDITNIHDVMVAVEKASVSFELMMEIRNKVIEAYREVMRTQV